MKALLFLLLIEGAILTTGNCLKCWKCENYNGKTCDSFIEQGCGFGVTKCVSTLTLQKMGNETVYQTMKSCAHDPKVCLATYNMTSKMEIYSKTECCEEDLCNMNPLTLDPIEEKENGVECPVCLNHEFCCTPEKNERIKCKGSQLYCYVFHGGLYNGTGFVDYSHQGCTTENVCNDLLKAYPESGLRPGFALTCLRSRRSS